MKNVIASCLSLFLFFVAQAQTTMPQVAEDIAPLLVGEKLPNSPLYTPNGEAKDLKDIINKPTVLIFYRGSWCPYCNTHLSELGKIEDNILKMGYQIVAVSPDDFQNLSGMIAKDSLKYQLFSDKNATLIKAMGIGFAASDKTKGYITKKTIGAVTEVLPVPSVFIVNEKGEILMEYINPTYTKRLSSKLLLAMLENLK